MKKRLVCAWRCLILCLLLALVASCAGGLPRQGSRATSAGDELYVLDSYASAGQQGLAQHIVALPVGTAKPAARFTFPAGLTDLEYRWIYAASPLSSGDGSARTRISVLDTRTGATVRSFSLPGSYSTADRGQANSMLSGDGRWLALRQAGTPTGATSIALVDTQDGKLVSSIHLTGDFTLDALSPRGTVLYLLEYYQAGTSHYNVRAYDVRANRLLPGSIVDKSDLSEKMQGNALSRQMSAGGDMAYTLYVNPVLNRAFIHILWLADALDSSVPFPTIARCIELPVGGSPALLRYYTLALSQDGQTLYAANAALGTLATVNLKAGMNSYQLWLIPNARVAHFDPGKSVPTVADQARELYHGAALARDQNSLYVVGLHGLWVIDTRSLKVRGQYLKEQGFTGLAESSDGRTLYVVSPTTGITLLDPGSGATRAVISGPVRAPWGIEWASQLTAS